MPQIRFLIDYLLPVSDALSYDHYDHPERIVNLLWAKENIDILADKGSLEKELSESVTMPDMGGFIRKGTQRILRSWKWQGRGADCCLFCRQRKPHAGIFR